MTYGEDISIQDYIDELIEGGELEIQPSNIAYFWDGAGFDTIARFLEEGYIVDCACGGREGHSSDEEYEEWVGQVAERAHKYMKDKNVKINFTYNSPDNEEVARFQIEPSVKTNQEAIFLLRKDFNLV